MKGIKVQLKMCILEFASTKKMQKLPRDANPFL